MIQEALVAFACINSTGCSETSSAYYNNNPEIKEMVKVAESQVNNFIGPTIVATLGPTIYVVAGGTGTIRLHRTLSLQVNKKQSVLMLGIDF